MINIPEIRLEENGKEVLYFNPKDMELNKLYEFVWLGDKHAIRKIDEKGTVEFLTWEPIT